MVGSEQNGNVDGLTSSPSKLLEATWKGIPASRGPCPAPAMVLLRPSPHSLQIQRLSPPLQWLFGKTPRQDVLGRIRVPAPRVLTEAARAQGEVLQTEAVPQRQGHALVVNLPALQAQALFCSALVVTPKAAWRWADCEVRVLTGFMGSMAFDLWKKNKPSDQAGIVPLPCNYS